MVDSENGNWVERRARRESTLSKQSLDVFEGLRKAIQDACDSFNAHYVDRGMTGATVEPENGKRIRISHTTPPDRITTIQAVRRSVLVVFDDQALTITSTEVGSDAASQVFRIEADQQRAFAMAGTTEVTADSMSQKILEPILFPNPARRQRPTYAHGDSQGWMS